MRIQITRESCFTSETLLVHQDTLLVVFHMNRVRR